MSASRDARPALAWLGAVALCSAANLVQLYFTQEFDASEKAVFLQESAASFAILFTWYATGAGVPYWIAIGSLRKERLMRPLWDVITCVLITGWWAHVVAWLVTYGPPGQSKLTYLQNLAKTFPPALVGGVLVALLYWFFAGRPKPPYER